MPNLNEFQLRQHRLRLAELSVGGSTVRGMPKGTVAAARAAFKRTQLGELPTTSRSSFTDALEHHTRRISKNLPSSSWGVSRKVLNIYLRSCVYDTPLRRAYGLAPLEAWLELPLDQQVGAGIRACTGENLPRFRNKTLSRELNARYQTAARRLARRIRVHPIHLESCWWRVTPGRCRCAA
jgi:hypothetical protein